MARTQAEVSDRIEGDFIRAESALKDAIAFLDIALQRIIRLYPQPVDHTYREQIREVHSDTVDLYKALSVEYGLRFDKHPHDLMKIVRGEIPQAAAAMEATNGKVTT